MTASPTSRTRGWCPGTLRPMQSGDGLLVRIKPSCGILSLEQTEAIATLARDHGNGLIELTSRGNLQLRGVRSETLDALTSALDALGLLDATPEAEAVRNVISSPLAGVDATAVDTRPVVKALEHELASDTSLAALSDKFGFLIDGGGTLPLTDIEADIRFVWRDGRFAIGLARETGCDWIGTCAPDDVPGVAITLTHAFLTQANGVRRMRHLSDKALQQVAVTAGQENLEPTRESDLLPSVALSGQSPVGIIEARAGLWVSGIGLPYGGTTSDALLGLMAIARRAGATELRLTPWRAILIPVYSHETAAALLTAAATLGFISDAADPRRAIAACPGAPACASGTTPVRADADLFATAAAGLLAGGATLHVSGCAKGCARRQAAALTLVAEAGRYGLVVNGTAAGPACGHFTARDVAETLARVASAMTQAGDASPTGRFAIEPAAIAAALKEIKAA